MKAAFVHRRISRSVAWRLAAGVLPAVLAVGLVVGLFYYGEAGRAAPRVILLAATALTAISIIVAWVNATYFAERLARLARATEQASGVGGPTDEFDRIEQAVGTLGSALSAAEAERARTDALAAARLGEQATMLAGAVSDSLAQLDQVRLPLQILLESPFGELNDNQEELLRDARAAADAIDSALRRLSQLADVDREAFQVQHELVQINDVVRSVLPLARAAAERRGARTETALEPGLPRVMADRARLAESLALFVTDAAASTSGSQPLSISTARDGPRAIIRIAPTSERTGVGPDSRKPDKASRSVAAGGDEDDSRTATFILASRLIEAQAGTVGLDGRTLELRIG
jgi:signal transduction histidine kinase